MILPRLLISNQNIQNGDVLRFLRAFGNLFIALFSLMFATGLIVGEPFGEALIVAAVVVGIPCGVGAVLLCMISARRRWKLKAAIDRLISLCVSVTPQCDGTSLQELEAGHSQLSLQLRDQLAIELSVDPKFMSPHSILLSAADSRILQDTLFLTVMQDVVSQRGSQPELWLTGDFRSVKTLADALSCLEQAILELEGSQA